MPSGTYVIPKESAPLLNTRQWLPCVYSGPVHSGGWNCISTGCPHWPRSLAKPWWSPCCAPRSGLHAQLLFPGTMLWMSPQGLPMMNKPCSRISPRPWPLVLSLNHSSFPSGLIDFFFFSALRFWLGPPCSTVAYFPNFRFWGSQGDGTGEGSWRCPFLPQRFLGSLCKFIHPSPKLCTQKVRATLKNQINKKSEPPKNQNYSKVERLWIWIIHSRGKACLLAIQNLLNSPSQQPSIREVLVKVTW